MAEKTFAIDTVKTEHPVSSGRSILPLYIHSFSLITSSPQPLASPYFLSVSRLVCWFFPPLVNVSLLQVIVDIDRFFIFTAELQTLVDVLNIHLEKTPELFLV